MHGVDLNEALRALCAGSFLRVEMLMNTGKDRCSRGSRVIWNGPRHGLLSAQDRSTRYGVLSRSRTGSSDRLSCAEQYRSDGLRPADLPGSAMRRSIETLPTYRSTHRNSITWADRQPSSRKGSDAWLDANERRAWRIQCGVGHSLSSSPSERSAEAADTGRTRRHWEVGPDQYRLGRSPIGTLVERTIAVTMLPVGLSRMEAHFRTVQGGGEERTLLLDLSWG